MSRASITGTIGTTDPSADLGVEVWVDQTLVTDVGHVTNDIDFSHTFDDTEQLHCLKIVLKNKKPDHTKIDDQGNIVEDARITIKTIAMEGIPLGQVLFDKTIYTHNFNGNGEETQHRFYGEMGCNGAVTMDFTTPLYLWLLESM